MWLFACVSGRLQIEDIIATVRDSNLKLTLAFGIGMHHAGLHERDRKTVEELFVNCKIQVKHHPPTTSALTYDLDPSVNSFTILSTDILLSHVLVASNFMSLIYHP